MILQPFLKCLPGDADMFAQPDMRQISSFDQFVDNSFADRQKFCNLGNCENKRHLFPRIAMYKVLLSRHDHSRRVPLTSVDFGQGRNAASASFLLRKSRSQAELTGASPSVMNTTSARLN